ncbi:MAG: xanthine dehydrogenase family protein subunit M [Thaumarchaeota archaeon]|nr:xanthine dehydrogenase family protein subunit M [Nitrososphaerota archaeon]
MILKPFEYSAPQSLQEACKLLEQHEDAKALAGGQSLLPIMKLNLTEVTHLVDLKRIPNLSFIEINKDTNSLNVGALTTHAEVAGSNVVKKTVPLLAETESRIGHPLVRNRGTIGGSISHCDPSGDLCVTSLALDSIMTIAKSDNSRRLVPARDFFQGTFTTALKKGEILEKISFPIPARGTGWAFEKLTMGHGDFPLIVVSVVLRVENEKCVSAAIALGGVADRAVRFPRAEDKLKGRKVSAVDIDKAAAIAEEESKPEADIDVSAEYKKKMIRVFVRRALTKAIEVSRSA